MSKASSIRTTISVSILGCLLTGCASTWNPKTPVDPYENYNRKVFAFNLEVDRHLYRPIAKGYRAITPKFVRNRITNFFDNVDQLSVIANNILQVNVPWTVSDVGRLLVNSTLGIGGLFDPATRFGLKKHDQDFGLTMAKWGVRESPYFIFPFFPPFTARDFFGWAVDGSAFTVWTYVDPNWVSYSARTLNLIQEREGLLSTDKLVDEAFDPYIFVRDFYLQRRKREITHVLDPSKVAENQESSNLPAESNKEEETKTSSQNTENKKSLEPVKNTSDVKA